MEALQLELTKRKKITAQSDEDLANKTIGMKNGSDLKAAD